MANISVNFENFLILQYVPKTNNQLLNKTNVKSFKAGLHITQDWLFLMKFFVY